MIDGEFVFPGMNGLQTAQRWRGPGLGYILVIAAHGRELQQR